jgi:hypothetical protein
VIRVVKIAADGTRLARPDASPPRRGRVEKCLKTVFFDVRPHLEKNFFEMLDRVFPRLYIAGVGWVSATVEASSQTVRRLIERAATDLVRATLQQVIPAPPGKPVQTHSRK